MAIDTWRLRDEAACPAKTTVAAKIQLVDLGRARRDSNSRPPGVVAAAAGCGNIYKRNSARAHAMVLPNTHPTLWHSLLA